MHMFMLDGGLAFGIALLTLTSVAVFADEWQVAQVLALTVEEAQDIQDSELRVKAMRKAVDERQYQKAYDYAITDGEREQIRKVEQQTK